MTIMDSAKAKLILKDLYNVDQGFVQSVMSQGFGKTILSYLSYGYDRGINNGLFIRPAVDFMTDYFGADSIFSDTY